MICRLENAISTDSSSKTVHWSAGRGWGEKSITWDMVAICHFHLHTHSSFLHIYIFLKSIWIFLCGIIHPLSQRLTSPGWVPLLQWTVQGWVWDTLRFSSWTGCQERGFLSSGIAKLVGCEPESAGATMSEDPASDWSQCMGKQSCELARETRILLIIYLECQDPALPEAIYSERFSFTSQSSFSLKLFWVVFLPLVLHVPSPAVIHLHNWFPISKITD